jgi:hypothetical protein
LIGPTPAVDRAAGGRQSAKMPPPERIPRRDAHCAADRADRAFDIWSRRCALIAAAGVALMKLFGVLSAKFTLSCAPPMEFRRSDGRPLFTRR